MLSNTDEESRDHAEIGKVNEAVQLSGVTSQNTHTHSLTQMHVGPSIALLP